MNKILVFYFVSIFMLANGSLFTWLFQGTPLNIWRQLIWLIGLMFFIRYIRITNSWELKKIARNHGIIGYVIFIQALLTYVICNFNVVRLGYAFWVYFAGLPFLLLPYLWAESGRKPQTFYNIFIILGLFLTIGLVIDFVSGGFFTRMFLVSVVSSSEGMLDDGRFCFLSEAPTTFGVYYSFCLFCTLYRLYISNSNTVKLILLFIALSFIIGAWLTGSRQIVFALALVFSVSFVYYIGFVKDKKSYVLIGLVILLLIAPSIQSFLFSEKSYQERYSSESIEEDTRYSSWERGFKENVENVEVFLIGKGVALSQGQKALDTEYVGSHYENTYYSRLSEIGIIGIILLLLPMIYLIRNWGKTTFFNISLLSFFLSYIFISYVSPNGSYQTTQMIVYLAWGVYLKKDFYCVDYSYDSYIYYPYRS